MSTDQLIMMFLITKLYLNSKFKPEAIAPGFSNAFILYDVRVKSFKIRCRLACMRIFRYSHHLQDSRFGRFP